MHADNTRCATKNTSTDTGQFPYVQAMLANTTDSHLIPINGGDTGEGVKCAATWAQDLERWDVVTYNFGAWNINMQDCNLTKNATTGAYTDPALEMYITELANVTATLLKTKAGKTGKLAFVLTTPSPQTKECCTDPAASSSTRPGMLRTDANSVNSRTQMGRPFLLPVTAVLGIREGRVGAAPITPESS